MSSGLVRVARERERLATRDRTVEWRSWYKTARWQALRNEVFKRDRYICQRSGQMCLGKGNAPDAPVANHKTPHHGDEGLFWDINNIETVTKAVHDSEIQSQEKSLFSKQIGEDGWPRDDRHPAISGVIPVTIGTAKSHPVWFRPTYVPLTIVCGPPGSGKSTYVDRHASMQDLVICFDRISTKMFGAAKDARSHASLSGSQVGDVLRARNDLLGKLMWSGARNTWPHAWLIVSEPKPDYRQWWHDKINPSRIVVLETPAAICKARVRADAEAGDIRHATVETTIDKWWRQYAHRQGDIIIKP